MHGKTDAELAELDVAELLRSGLGGGTAGGGGGGTAGGTAGSSAGSSAGGSTGGAGGGERAPGAAVGGGTAGRAGGRVELFGDGAVAAAIALGEVAVIPRSVSFLAEIVRSGGIRYAAELPEPLPFPAQTDVIRPWLTAAATVPGAADEQLARWLEAVASVLALRAGTHQTP